ncbi:MAG: hypothetical protein WCE75_17370 [Terracidiphilus sp.]
MKVAVVSAILLAAVAGQAQTVAQPSIIGSLKVKEISLVEIDQTHVKAAVNVEVVPSRSVTLKNMRLAGLYLNGQAVFASALNQELALQKDAPTALPPLYVTVLFRDVQTVEPIRQMVDKRSVHVEGSLVADLKLNFLERLALGTQHPKAELPLDQEVPVEIGGSALQRTAVNAVLALIDTGLKAKAAANHLIPSLRPAWIRDLEAQSANVYMVESTFTIKEQDKEYQLKQDQLGFRVAPDAVITTAEAVAPWKYDAEAMGAIQSGEAKLEKKTVEVVMAPAAPGGMASSLSGKESGKTVHGSPDKDSITMGGSYGQVKVLRRASPGSMAILPLRPAATTQGLALAPAGIAGQNVWEHVAVFRLHIDPTTGQPSVEVLELGARRNGAGIQLTEPVDSAVCGSPIVAPEGVIGIVQDEDAGSLLPSE